ncbi:2TM domain-containing protein [uncultured Polaribacter sp.]|uniref:2TM domain-containing protein n=1 Tax=uncultured Polaribacter sp. TaxID=174711 RepID=UPI002625D467|nr:2TM domain-containing protein [uncultured Polaribacter sp.]
MKLREINEQENHKIQKRITDLKGFYTHIIASFIIPPFLIFINFKTVPSFHWFWIALSAWFLGLFIHWLVVFGFDKLQITKKWEQNQMENLLNSKTIQPTAFIKEQYFVQIKKKVAQIKDFYIHLLITIFCIVVVVFVNIKFVPNFNFYGFAIAALCIALFLNWLGVFGLDLLGFGKKWETKKIKEITKQL